VKQNQSPIHLHTKLPMPAAASLFTMLLFSGAAYAPPLLNPQQVLPLSRLETPVPQIVTIRPAPRPPEAIQPRAAQSKLAQRMNNRYRVGSNVRASA